MFRKPLATKSTPRVMFSVDAKFPPITMPTSSNRPTATDSQLSAPLVLRLHTVSPPVSKKPIRSMIPKIPKTSSPRPIRPAPIR